MLGHFWWAIQTTFWDWQLSRPRSRWLLRLLMLVLIPGSVALIVVAFRLDYQRIRGQYLLAAKEAIRTENFAQAELFFRKVAYLNPNQDELALDYWHALLAEKQGDLDRSRRLMYRLVIRRGTPPTILVGAHLWFCDDVLRAEKLTRREFEQIALHLTAILAQEQPLSPSGEPLTATTRGLAMIAESVSHIRLRLPRMFQINLQTARFLATNGDALVARQLVDRAIGILQQFVSSEPTNIDYAILLANSLCFAERYQEAEQSLIACYRSTHDARVEKGLVNVYLEAAQSAQSRSDGPSPEVVKIVQQAYLLAHDDPDILDRMATFLGAGIGFDAKTLATLDLHIHNRVAEKPQDIDRRFTLANLYLAQQKFELAAQELAQVAVERPAARLILARVFRRLQRPTEADEQIRLAVNYFLPRLKEDPARASDRLLLADLMAENGKWEQAIELIQRGLPESNSSQLRSGLAYLYFRWAELTDNPPTKLERLFTGLDALPDHAGIQTRLLSLANEEGATGELTLRLLRERLLLGKDAPFIHLAMGTAAAGKKDFATALTHLSVAQVAMPKNSLLLNNLAHVLLHTTPPEPRRALTHIELARQINPNAAEIRETRGEVLMALERWEEAVSELELALRHSSNQKKLHTMLAEAYTRLGNGELATQHAQAAQSDR